MEPAEKAFHREEIRVWDKIVFCEGDSRLALGHPRVYLEIGAGDRVTCPYCGRCFVLEEGGRGADSPQYIDS